MATKPGLESRVHRNARVTYDTLRVLDQLDWEEEQRKKQQERLNERSARASQDIARDFGEFLQTRREYEAEPVTAPRSRRENSADYYFGDSTGTRHQGSGRDLGKLTITGNTSGKRRMEYDRNQEKLKEYEGVSNQQLYTQADLAQQTARSAQMERNQMASELAANPGLIFNQEFTQGLSGATARADATAQAASRAMGKFNTVAELRRKVDEQSNYGYLNQNPDYAKYSSGDEETAKRANNSLSPKMIRYYNIYNRDKIQSGVTSGAPAEAYVTDDEAGRYFYLWAKQGADAAEAYYNTYVKDRAQERRTNKERQNVQDLATSSPVMSAAMSAASVPLQATGIIGMIDLTIQNAERRIGINADKPINYNTAWQAPSDQASAIRESVSNKIQTDVTKNLLESGHSEKTANWWGAAASFAYQTGMSMADSGVQALLVRVGIPEAATLTLMAGGAGMSSIREAKQRGASDGEALAYGYAAAFAEGIFEHVSLENLMTAKTPRKFWQGVKEVAKQSFAEGSEEFATTYANTLTDMLINGGASEISQKVQSYMADGLSNKEAYKAAAINWLKNAGMDFLGGALSGGAMGAGNVGVNLALNYAQDFQTGRAINDALRQEQAAPVQEQAASQAPALMIPTQETQNARRTDPLGYALEKVGNGETLTGGDARAILENPQAVQSLRDAGVLTEAVKSGNEGRKQVNAAVAALAEQNRAVNADLQQETEQNTPFPVQNQQETAQERTTPPMPEQRQAETPVPQIPAEGRLRVREQTETPPLPSRLTVRAENGTLRENRQEGNENVTVQEEAQAATDSQGSDFATRARIAAAGRQGSNRSERTSGVGRLLEDLRTTQAIRGARSRADAAGRLGVEADVRNQREVSAQDLGVQYGTEEKTARLLDNSFAAQHLGKDWTRAVEAYAQRGVKLQAMTGQLQRQMPGGETSNVRAFVSGDGKTITVQADHPYLSWNQLLDHEELHRRIKEDAGYRQEVQDALLADETLKPRLAEILDAYTEAYRSVDPTMTAEDINEELLADYRAGFDMLDPLGLKSETRTATKAAAKDIRAVEKRYTTNGGREAPEGITEQFAEAKNSVEPPYRLGTKSATDFEQRLSEKARGVYDMFLAVHNASQDNLATMDVGSGKSVHAKQVPIADRFLTADEWNEQVKNNSEFAQAARNIFATIPADIRKNARLNDDGTITETGFEKHFKMARSLMQRLVDALPKGVVDSTVELDGKKIQVARGRVTASVGGEEYRRALVSERRDLFKNGKLPTRSIDSLSHDNWGAMGFLATNTKTIASGDFTTFCPQMYFNDGCWYCYRRSALTTGINNKLTAETVWYAGEILQLRQEDIDRLNEVGGLRIQSFGDWQSQYSTMLADLLIDAEKVGLQIKVITKEPSMIDTVALLKEQGLGKSLYFNLSADYTIERRGQVDNTNTSDALPMNPERPFLKKENAAGEEETWWKRALTVEEANEYRKMYPWVNTRIVATNADEFIRGLKDPTVDVVTGYHGTIRQYERVSSETGEVLMDVEPLGDSGMPRFAYNRKTGEWTLEYEGKTKYQKQLAQRIQEEGLEREYYTKSCCIFGRCAKCQGKCGSYARSFEVKNATNRDQESVKYWQREMESGVDNPLLESQQEGKASTEIDAPYNRTAIVSEETVDRWLKDYASQSSPKYAQAYITRMSPEQFLKLTTSRTGRLMVNSQTGPMDAEKLIKATQEQPLQLKISDGEVVGHEGRHRATALSRANVQSIPVLVFDSSNKYSKTDVPEMVLQGQDFGSSRSYDRVTLENLTPLSYENRDRIVQEYGKQDAYERSAEKLGYRQTMKFSIEIDPEVAAQFGPEAIALRQEKRSKGVKGERKVSKVRSNTYDVSGLFNEVESQMAEADEENYTYDVVSEKKSMNEALGRLKADFDGEVSRLSEADRQWGGSDLDTAMGILHRYRSEGRATGNYTDFWNWSKTIQEKGTKGGQFIQAFAKYTRTGTGTATKAASDLFKQNQLNPAQQKRIKGHVENIMNGMDAQGAADDAMKQAKGKKEPTKKQDGKVDKKKLDAETQRRKDAERMVREIYNIFGQQQDDHGEPVKDWLKLTGEELAKKIASRFDERAPRQKTTMQTILGDLVGFAQEHALPDRKKTEGERRTAIDTITDYLSNRDAYGTAWAQAQAVLRGQYAGDQEKLDALEGFLGATIAYNAEGTDRTMLDAILQSADVLGISEKRILELASAGATESTISRIGDELVNQVQERMGADWQEEFGRQLKDAARRHITGIALSESASEQALRLGRMETAAARQLDINLQKILTESRLTKQDAARRVADYLIRELGIPSSDAAIAAQRISDSFMDELAVRADRRLGQMFAEKTPKAREQRDKLLDLLRLGGFTNANVEDAVVDALGIGKLSREEQKRITGDMARFGETLDAITDDDLDGLRALIREQAAARNTPLSRQAEKVLAGETDAEYLRDFALAQLDAIAGDYAEPNPGAKISTFQTISHLLNMRTALRNLTSNQVFDLVDSAANNLATIPDMVIGAITGKRTVGVNRSWLSEMKRAGAKQGAGRNLLEVRLDVSPDDRQKSKYGTAGRRTNSMANSNAFGRILSHLEEAMGYELNTTDEFHKGSVRGETLESLARFVERGDITQEQANAWAEEEALYRSFQDDTLVGNIMGELKTLLNVIGFGDSGKKNSRGRTIHDFGLGDLVVKYTQVPGALIHRGIEYSPLGYAKMVYDLAIAKDSLVRTQKRGEDVASAQRKLALDIGRATTGTGLVTLFAVLAKAGLLRRDDDDKDKNAKAMHAAQGLSGTQLNVTALGRWIGGEDADPQDGDVLADIGFLEPLDSLMTIATLLANDKDLSLSDIGTKSLDGIWKAISNTSAMQTISNIIQTVQYHDEENDLPLYFQIPIEIASDSISGFIPSPVRQLAQATDTTYRDQYRSRNVNDQIRAKAANSIPGVRQMLAPKITPLGEDKKYQKPLLNYLNATLNPGNVSVYQSSRVVDELNRVYGETEDAKIWPERNAPYSFTANDEKWTLTPDERTQYQRTRGQNTAKIMEDVMGTDWYKAMDGTAQAEVLNWIGNFSNFIAKKEMLEARGVDYGSATYDKYYSALAGGTPAADVVAGKYSKQVAAAEETAAAETIIAEAKIPEASREEAETMSAEGKRFYAGFLKGGVSDATARKLASELEGSEASGHEQWRMIYNSAGSEGEKAVTSVMTEDMKRNWELAKSVGVSMDDYIKVREGYLDLDGNGSQKQAEWNATLDQFTFSKNETEDKRIKGTLWQIYTGSTSTKYNPYDKEAGQTVIDAKGKGGGKGTGSNAPARIPTLRLPDTPKAEKPSSGLRIRAAAPAQAPRSGLRIRAK